jgi:D-serine deaminase-like pyridoxal phosphate-dependent protein
MHITELPTPALLLELETLTRNLKRMQTKLHSLGTSLRPHIKTHKCVEVAKRQRDLGAQGITVSTYYEAEQFAASGFNDITWAFPLPPVYADRCVELAKKVTLRVVVDSVEATAVLKDACAKHGTQIHVWLKIDCGYHRAGVDPSSPQAENLVRLLSESDALRFDGILSHSGHAYHGTTRQDIVAVANQERTVMVEFAERMRKKGYPVPSISIGSTPSMSVIETLDGISEARPGNYCFYDRTMVELGVCKPSDCAVTVLASVISHQPGASHFVIDAGALALSKDQGPAVAGKEVAMGVVLNGYDTRSYDHTVTVRTLSQEHGKVTADQPSDLEGKYRVGDRIRILENHSCLTVAHFDAYNVVQGENVIDRWQILRGRA